MKKAFIRILRFCFLVFLIMGAYGSKAQYITIPDTAFGNWLYANGFAGCMSGSRLDTTCPAVQNATSVYCYGVPIKDLTGIQYFSNLDTLECSNDSLYNIPALPASLVYFNCAMNNLSTLPALPAGLLSFNCSGNGTSVLPVLPSGLKTLFCGYNGYCLPAQLPAGLDTLSCRDLNCNYLPPLPVTLKYLDCGQMLLYRLPALPAALTYLDCSNNNGPALDTLPPLPSGLNVLTCYDDGLNTLPVLPASITSIDCASNNLTNLPALPDSLSELDCEFNHLTTLPPLPASISEIDCDDNDLISLPTFPDNLFLLFCDNNPSLTCLPDLNHVYEMSFYGTGINCLPNYGMLGITTPALGTVPLCGIFNSNGCQPFWDISGQAYVDNNANCIDDSLDGGLTGAKIMVYNSGTLLQQVYAGEEGFYSFDSLAYATYNVLVDTSNLPFTASCPDSSLHQVTLSAADSFSNHNNFAFKCISPGFDVGVEYIVNNSVVPRPAANITLYTAAGDMTQPYGAHCAAGISGQVQLAYTGSVTYLGPAAGALTPTTVSGNTITWNIGDFGAINNSTAFNLAFQVNANAVSGSQVCIKVNVLPETGDYNPGNNTGNYCFTIADAQDPNLKEVYPTAEVGVANPWLTYTVRFQNTGTAPALNIRITDTLDNNLDPSTFQLLSSSAKNLTQLFGNNVVFNFPGINLPDMATSDSASRGYIQYKIKLKNNTPVGTTISNTAYIYFDLNSPVVTNTVTDTLVIQPAAIASIVAPGSITLYPNPATDQLIIKTENINPQTVTIYDVGGRMILTQPFKPEIDVNRLSNGVYFIEITSDICVSRKRFVKM